MRALHWLVTSVALGLVAAPALAQSQQNQQQQQAQQLQLVAGEEPLEETRKDIKKDNIKMESLPTQVRTSIEGWTQGRKIEKIEQITAGGQIQYKAQLEKNGKKLELLLNSQGKVLRAGKEVT
jgi:hypothetical protein